MLRNLCMYLVPCHALLVCCAKPGHTRNMTHTILWSILREDTCNIITYHAILREDTHSTIKYNTDTISGGGYTPCITNRHTTLGIYWEENRRGGALGIAITSTLRCCPRKYLKVFHVIQLIQFDYITICVHSFATEYHGSGYEDNLDCSQARPHESN